MAFPPEFSSTLTYENRYDLDEIDVFLEGNANNPMFFNINGLPQNLSFGKHYFYLSTLNPSFPNNQYQLRQNSKILFEFKSINNVILKSDVLSIEQQNGIATCFVEVLKDPLRTFKEVEDGQGTLTIVGSIQDNPELSNPQNPITEKFIGAMNYRCVFPIQIRKNLINADSPFTLQSEHKKSTIKGMFSFVKAGIAAPKHTNQGITLDPLTGGPDTSRQNTGGGGGSS
jgi:hypothetical protein